MQACKLSFHIFDSELLLVPVAVVEFEQSRPLVGLQRHFTLLPERFGALAKVLPQQEGVDVSEQIGRNAAGHDFSPRGLLDSGRG